MAKGETLREGSKVPVPKPRRPTLTNKVVRGLAMILDDAKSDGDRAADRGKTELADVEAGEDYIQKLIAWHDARQSNGKPSQG